MRTSIACLLLIAASPAFATPPATPVATPNATSTSKAKPFAKFTLSHRMQKSSSVAYEPGGSHFVTDAGLDVLHKEAARLGGLQGAARYELSLKRADDDPSSTTVTARVKLFH